MRVELSRWTAEQLEVVSRFLIGYLCSRAASVAFETIGAVPLS